MRGALDTGRSVEISRFLILPDDRSGAVFMGFIRLVFRHVLAQYGGHRAVYFAVERRMLDLINALGFDFQPFAPTAQWYGDPLVPARQSVATLEPVMRRKNPGFHAWLWRDPGILERHDRLRGYLKGESCSEPAPAGGVQ